MSDSIDYNLADITSHNIALHFLSNNIGSTSNLSSISTPQLIQHINGNNQHSNGINSTANINHSTITNHSDIHQEQVEASKSPIRIPKIQQSELLVIDHHKKEELLKIYIRGNWLGQLAVKLFKLNSIHLVNDFSTYMLKNH